MKAAPSFILWFLLLGIVVSVKALPMERSTPLLEEEGRPIKNDDTPSL